MKVLRGKNILNIIMTTHVYVVLEIPSFCDIEKCLVEHGEAKVHGVFANREHAELKALKLQTRHHKAGYVAVLKQRIKGV